MFYSLAGVWSRSCCKRSVGWFGAISRQYAKLDALFADVRQELKKICRLEGVHINSWKELRIKTNN